MSTRSTIGYVTSTDEFRGTYVHFDGDTVGFEFHKMLTENPDLDPIQWVEDGIAGGGYSFIGTDCAPYGDGVNLIKGSDLRDAYIEYAYTVGSDRTVRLHPDSNRTDALAW